MKYINTLREHDHVSEVYLVKESRTLMTKAGKPYDSLILQDKTGTLDAKIWDVGSPGIEECKALDYVRVAGDITSFQGNLQLRVQRLQRVDSAGLDPADFLPVTEGDIPAMYRALTAYIEEIQSPALRRLLESFFADPAFEQRFTAHSAARSVHHSFVGGLVEHTLHVTQTCAFFCTQYPMLQRDLLLAAAMLHDVGKLDELSDFPANDFTDEGQLLGHIAIGAMEVQRHIDAIPDFPERTGRELVHCILAHHGKLEYGSPKLPALMEAVALHFVDNADAKLETMKEAFANAPEGSTEWLGFNRFMETNIRPTGSAEDT